MEEQNPNPPQTESKKAKSAVGKLVAVIVAVVVVAGVAGVLLQSGYFKGLFGAPTLNFDPTPPVVDLYQ